MYLCVYMHIQIHICIHVDIHVYIYIYTYIHTSNFICMCMSIHVYTCKCAVVPYMVYMGVHRFSGPCNSFSCQVLVEGHVFGSYTAGLARGICLESRLLSVLFDVSCSWIDLHVDDVCLGLLHDSCAVHP